jgi:hypothetical protein
LSPGLTIKESARGNMIYLKAKFTIKSETKFTIKILLALIVLLAIPTTAIGQPEPTPPYEITGSNLRDFNCGIFYGLGYASAIYKVDPFQFQPTDPTVAQPCYDAGYTYGLRYQKAQQKRNSVK